MFGKLIMGNGWDDGIGDAAYVQDKLESNETTTAS
jgi:hypothetical protein